MWTTKLSAAVTLVWGALSLVALLLCYLALTDIGHGEADLTQEWTMLRVGFVTILLFHLPALATAIQTVTGYQDSED